MVSNPDSRPNKFSDAQVQGVSIVVLGGMNPTLHHPWWYRTNGGISEDEEQQALSRPFALLPQYSQFSTDDVEILCLPDRWQVLSRNHDAERASKICKLVFDERLNETHVNSVGINFHIHHATSNQHVAKTLAQMVSSLGLGFSGDADCDGRVSFYERTKEASLRWEVSTSTLQPDAFYLAFSIHHEVVDILGERSRPEPFSLGSIIENRLPSYQELLSSKLSSISTVMTMAKTGA